jgi:hypothetical protein
MATDKTKPELRLCWYPQMPCKPFISTASSAKEIKILRETLANYDLFQFENQIKPDYCNMGVVERFDPEDTEDSPEGTWVEVDDDELEEMIDDEVPVGNGGEREQDGEWLEDTEWLESMGFSVECGFEDSDRCWSKTITSGVRVTVSPTGSTSLRWKHHCSDGTTDLYFGLDDDATRGDIRKLLDVFGALPEQSP